jgi:hypothetical protein
MLMVLQKTPPIQHLHMRLEWTEFQGNPKADLYQIAHWDRPKHLALKTEAPVLPNDPFKWRKRSSLRLGVLCGLSVLLLEHLLVLCWSGSTHGEPNSQNRSPARQRTARWQQTRLSPGVFCQSAAAYPFRGLSRFGSAQHAQRTSAQCRCRGD